MEYLSISEDTPICLELFTDSRFPWNSLEELDVKMHCKNQQRGWKWTEGEFTVDNDTSFSIFPFL